jgi:hypothetical protein
MPSSEVYIHFSDDDNTVLGVYSNKEDAETAAMVRNDGYIDTYAVNDDWEDMVYLTVPVTLGEYDQIIDYANDQGVSPTVLFRSILLDELAK